MIGLVDLDRKNKTDTDHAQGLTYLQVDIIMKNLSPKVYGWTGTPAIQPAKREDYVAID